MSKIEELTTCLRLINAQNVGPASFYRMVNNFGSLEATLAMVEKTEKYRPWSLSRAKEEIEMAKKFKVHILTYLDDEYPFMLKQVDNPPPIIYVKGNLDALNYEKSVAMVGARAASANGRRTAAKLAFDLTENNVCVISGMARGIDASAHMGAMMAKEGTGSTIAVLGTGIDVIYPAENRDLYKNIIVNGCVISEFPMGTKVSTQNFPRRNRTIAALSGGVLVVEAGLQSGSLITANWASKLHKGIFAVPGTPGEARSQGVNHLIKSGARLVENVQDVVSFLDKNKHWFEPYRKQPTQKVLVFENKNANLTKQKFESVDLLSLISVDGTDIDEIIRLSERPTTTVIAQILELEMLGLVERQAGNKVALVK